MRTQKHNIPDHVSTGNTSEVSNVAISVRDIVKRYGAKKSVTTAVQGISFDVANAELFGLIGPDGAGKTSLIRMLATLLLPDEGRAAVNGFDVVKDYKSIRQQIGYMPGRFSLYPDLTVQENLDFFATIFNTSIDENYGLIKDIYSQIEPFKDRKAGKLSGGMKQKLALSCAMIHRPSVLFLDEPTTGVDAVSRKEFWEMLKSLKEKGITILVSTPYMNEAALCDRVALIQAGKIMSIDTPSNIIDAFSSGLYALKGRDMPGLLKQVKSLQTITDVYPFGEYHHVVMDDNSARELAIFLSNKGIEHELKPVKPDIEDCFIALMKHHDN